MKLSSYNIYVEKNDESVIVYNTRTMAFAKMKKENYQKLIVKSFDTFDENTLDQLICGGFVINDEVDELSIIKHNMNRARYSTEILSLTITPTMSCNFNCVYCFENRPDKSQMTQKTMDGIIEFVKSKLKKSQILRVTWFGGEPLLAFPCIEFLSREFIKICKDLNCKYSAIIITNGYLLTEEICAKLSELLITEVQITLDGVEIEHNARRPLRNGNGSYSRIINNLKLFSKYDTCIQIRINVDKKNGRTIKALIDEINNCKIRNLAIGVGQIDPYNECCEQQSCYDTSEFAAMELKIWRYLHELGIRSNFDYLPFRRANHCAADNINSFIIDENGSIYKCWADVGRKELSIGTIYDKQINNMTRYLNYISFDPTTNEICAKCPVMPLCMGGCPNKRQNGLETCQSIKFNVEQVLLNYYEKYERKA